MQQPSPIPPKPSNTIFSDWLPRLFILFWVLLVWSIGGLFVAFVCNGGAGGSTEMSGFAWTGLLIYTLIFFRFFLRVAKDLFAKRDD